MNYAIEMALGAMIYRLNFIKIGSGIEKLFLKGYTYRHTDSKVIS
jgi:hypothetical protein